MPEQKTIAIVAGNPVVRAYVSILMVDSHLSVVFEATSGQDCLARIQEAGKAPCVVIIDISMPVKDEFKTALTLKSDWPDTKIIALSSSNDPLTVDPIIEAGADFCISKQCSIKSPLINTLDILLN